MPFDRHVRLIILPGSEDALGSESVKANHCGAGYGCRVGLVFYSGVGFQLEVDRTVGPRGLRHRSADHLTQSGDARR